MSKRLAPSDVAKADARLEEYTAAHLIADLTRLGGAPRDAEIGRLLERYPSYKLSVGQWRLAITEAVNRALETGRPVNNADILAEKLRRKGIDEDSLSVQARGGHTRMLDNKLMKAAMRLYYLRLVDDEGMKRRQANARVLQAFPYFGDAEKDGSSAVRKITSFKPKKVYK